MVSQGFFSGSADRDKRVSGSSDVKTAGIKTFLQKKVDQQLNKMTKEGKTPFGTSIGGSAVGDEGLGRFGNTSRETSFVSPSGNEVGQIASSDLSGLRVESPSVQLANVKSYTDQTYTPSYPGDDYKDALKKSYRDDRSEEEKNRDAIKNFFTREDKGVFKNKDEFDRKMTTYYTDKDGNPAAVNAFGEKVNYDTAKIKRYIATDAKEDYQNKQQQSAKQKLDQGLAALQEQNQRVDDFNYYKRNLTFNEKGEADPTNKYVLTAPEMRERMKDLDRNESMDKYGIIRPYKEQEKINRINEAERNRLQKAKEPTENKSILQRVGDFVGGTFNALTGTQAAYGDTLQAQGINTDPGVVSNMNTITAGDTSFSSYVRGAKEGQERGNTGLAEARKIANRNPNVSIVGGRAVAANDSGKARAQAAAVNRKIQGKTISQVNADNGKSMQDRARKRNKAFKKSRQQKKKSDGGQGFGGPKSSPSTSRSRGGISRSTSRGQGGGPSSRSRGGTSRGSSRSGTRSSSSRGQGSRSRSTSRSKGGVSRGSRRGRTGRGGRRGGRRCDIRCKIDISPLINNNLVRDDLAELAYFVQEIR